MSVVRTSPGRPPLEQPIRRTYELHASPPHALDTPRPGCRHHRLWRRDGSDPAGGPDEVGLHGAPHQCGRRAADHPAGPDRRAGRLWEHGDQRDRDGHRGARGEPGRGDAVGHAHGGGDPRDRHVQQPADRPAGQRLHARGERGGAQRGDQRPVCCHADVHRGERQWQPHLRAHGRGRHLLLGRQHLRPARRRDHDRAIDPRARGGWRELRDGERRWHPHLRGHGRRRRLLLGR